MKINKIEQSTPNKLIYKRFLKNKGAVFGVLIIALAIFFALFAYVIAPDNTPNANNQVTDIQLENPGFTQLFLLQRKNIFLEERSVLKKMWSGETERHKWIPIDSYEFVKDSMSYKLNYSYKGSKSFMELKDVLYPLSQSSPNGIQTSLDGRIIEEDAMVLQNLIEKQHLKKRTFLLGTDKYGRDVFSRLLIGVRISLLVGLIAVIISLIIGIFLGSMAGYFGGRTDDLIMFLINTVWSIPTLLLVFAIVLAFGKNISNIFIAVGLTMWVDVARIVRGQIMGLKKVEFVEAARIAGLPNFQIIRKHLLPNIIGPLTVVAAANFATAILLEAGLSYLGFGIQAPTPSWGTMLNENYGFAISGKPIIALVPALAILFLVLAFNLLGNGLRDAIDVKS